MLHFENFASKEEIFEIEKICFNECWSLEQIESHLHHHHILALYLNKTLLGYILFILSIDEIEILKIAILPEFRKLKYASKLISKLEGIFNPKKIFLEVNCKNEQAILFYEKNSFQKIGIRKKYYPNGDDAILFLKEAINESKKFYI